MSTVITTTGGLTVVNSGRTYINVSVGAYLSGATVFFFINNHESHAFSDGLGNITLDGVALSVAGFDALKVALSKSTLVETNRLLGDINEYLATI